MLNGLIFKSTLHFYTDSRNRNREKELRGTPYEFLNEKSYSRILTPLIEL